MVTNETDILSDLIRVKRECLLQLREMGIKQRSFIDEGDMKSLMEILAVKQRPLTTLRRIERALDPFRKQDPDKRSWKSVDARTHCAEQIESCESLLKEIVNQEKQCEAALIKRRDEAAMQLQGVHLAGNARQAYLPQNNSPMGQIDLFSGK